MPKISYSWKSAWWGDSCGALRNSELRNSGEILTFAACFFKSK